MLPLLLCVTPHLQLPTDLPHLLCFFFMCCIAWQHSVSGEAASQVFALPLYCANSLNNKKHPRPAPPAPPPPSFSATNLYSLCAPTPRYGYAPPPLLLGAPVPFAGHLSLCKLERIVSALCLPEDCTCEGRLRDPVPPPPLPAPSLLHPLPTPSLPHPLPGSSPLPV